MEAPRKALVACYGSNQRYETSQGIRPLVWCQESCCAPPKYLLGAGLNRGLTNFSSRYPSAGDRLLNVVSYDACVFFWVEQDGIKQKIYREAYGLSKCFSFFVWVYWSGTINRHWQYPSLPAGYPDSAPITLSSRNYSSEHRFHH